MTARLARLLDRIVAESGEYADHAGHVRAGVYRAHARVRALALQARRHLAGGLAAAPAKKTRISAREAAAMADIEARRAAKFGPPISRARRRVYIKTLKDSKKRRPTGRRNERG